jgi:hypothetical protein
MKKIIIFLLIGTQLSFCSKEIKENEPESVIIVHGRDVQALVGTLVGLPRGWIAKRTFTTTQTVTETWLSANYPSRVISGALFSNGARLESDNIVGNFSVELCKFTGGPGVAMPHIVAYFPAKGSNGASNAHTITVRNCEFDDLGEVNSSGGNDAQRGAIEGGHFLFERNVVHNTPKGVTVSAGQATIRENYFYDVISDGITHCEPVLFQYLDVADGPVIIERNWIQGNYKAGYTGGMMSAALAIYNDGNLAGVPIRILNNRMMSDTWYCFYGGVLSVKGGKFPTDMVVTGNDFWKDGGTYWGGVTSYGVSPPVSGYSQESAGAVRTWSGNTDGRGTTINAPGYAAP